MMVDYSTLLIFRGVHQAKASASNWTAIKEKYFGGGT